MFGPEASRAVSARSRLHHPAGWQWVLLTDVAKLASGHTPDRAREDYWGGDIPWISLPEIRRLDGEVALSTELRISPQGLAKSSAVLLPPGTVSLSRTASLGLVTKLGVPMATSQDFFNWTCGDRLQSDYLWQALRSSRAELVSTSDGSIHKTIYRRVAERFQVLVPPLELQREFASRKTLIVERRDLIVRAGERAEELCNSLSARAFIGKV